MKTDEKYITFRKDRNSYQVCIKVVDEEGKIHSCTATAKTLEEAKIKRDELIETKRINKDILLAPIARAKAVQRATVPNTKISDIIENWYQEEKKDRIEKSTAHGITGYIHNYIIPVFGRYRPAEVQKSMVKQWVKGLQENGGVSGKPISDGTLKKILTCFKEFLQWCECKHLVEENPCRNIRINPVRPVKHRRALTEDEEAKLFSYMKKDNPAMWFLMKFYMETDSRRGEVLALRWCDIDFEQRTVTFKNNLVMTGSEIYLNDHNKNHVIKTLPLSSQASLTLKSMFDQQKREEKDFDTEKTFIFHRKGEKYIRPNYVTDYFRSVKRKLGLPEELCVHCLRHTATTKLICNGVSLERVKSIGGWKNVQTMIDTYTHIGVEDIRNELEHVLFKREY